MLKYSEDKVVVFDSEKHTYHIGADRLTGVTTLISRFKEKFDAPKAAAAYVLKHGGNMEDLLQKWEKAGADSCEAGTAVHNVFENYFITGNIIKTGFYPKELIAEKFIKEMFLTGRLTPVCVEEVVYSKQLMIASQVDMIAKDKAGNHYILDWKTNKEIKKDSWGKMMKPPFSALPDSNFYHYSLQVKIYKLLCQKYKISDCYIVHIADNGYSVIKGFDDGQDVLKQLSAWT